MMVSNLRETSKKGALFIECHYYVWSKMRKNDILEVRYLKNDNGDPVFITFSEREIENVFYKEV